MDAFVSFVGFLIFMGIGYLVYQNWPGREKDEERGKPQRQDDGGDAKK